MEGLHFGKLVAGTVLTALLLALAHWFPWVDPNRKLRNYALGTAGIVAGFGLWRLLERDWVTVTGLVVIAAVAGLTTIRTYGIDTLVHGLARAEMARRADDELSDR